MAIHVDKFILCDDIRKENTGEFAIIGMYHEDKIIILGDLPYRHNLLSFFVNVSGDLKEGEINYKILDPNDRIILETPPIKVDKPVKKANLIAGISQLEFNSQGTYNLQILFPPNESITIPFYVETRKSPTT